MLIVTIIFVLLTVRKWQSSRIKMHYQPSSNLWAEVFKQTDLMKMKYKPSIWALHPFTQFFWFTVLSIVEMIRKPIKYRRQIFELYDGGELAIDWLETNQDRNLVICIPGLSGDSNEIYCTSIAKVCQQRNIDFCVINYRGLSGVPLKVSFLTKCYRPHCYIILVTQETYQK